jgi:hypothetical protein
MTHLPGDVVFHKLGKIRVIAAKRWANRLGCNHSHRLEYRLGCWFGSGRKFRFRDWFWFYNRFGYFWFVH